TCLKNRLCWFDSDSQHLFPWASSAWVMYYDYVLYSHKDKKLYTGYSDDLKKRLARHLAGAVTATRHRLPLELIYYEAYRGKDDATKREYFLKRGRGRELLKELLENSIPK